MDRQDMLTRPGEEDCPYENGDVRRGAWLDGYNFAVAVSVQLLTDALRSRANLNDKSGRE